MGVFDSFKSDSKNTSDIANELHLDCELTYRLLRALGSLRLLKEEVDSKGGSNRFSLTQRGKLLTNVHTQSLRGITLLEEGPEHYAIWKHLPAMIKDGQQNAFLREFGYKIFDYAERNVDYATTFNQAMASYSAAQTTWVLEALETDNFTNVTQHFFKWLHNCSLDRSKDRSSLSTNWYTPEFVNIKKKRTKRLSPYGEHEIWDIKELQAVIKYEPHKRNRANTVTPLGLKRAQS